MVWALVLCLVMAAVLHGSAEQVNAADFHVTTAVDFEIALDTAENNGEDDVIYLAAGTYEGNFGYNPQDGMSLTIKGELGTTAEDVILDGGGTGTVLYPSGSSEGGSVSIEGLTIQNGSDSGLRVYFENGNLDITLSHVVIQNNSDEYRGGGISVRPCGNADVNMEIWNSVIRYNQSPGYATGGQGRGGGIYAHSYGGNNTIDLLIVNSLIYKNEANWTGGGINISASEVGDNNVTRAVVVNSTIASNVSDMHDIGWNPGGGIRVSASGGNGTIASLDLYNTIIYGNMSLGGEAGQDVHVEESEPGDATVNAYHCDIDDVDADAGTYSPVSVINADPTFVNPTNDDYHLTAGSPCIDAGTIAVPDPPGLPATDFEGNPRVSGAAPDMGAYEWTGAPALPTIAFDPSSFSFSATEDGANPADQTLDIWNSGADTLDCSITDDADWLSLSPETGSSTGPADVTEVTVSVDISGITADSYSGTITISDPAAANSPQTVPVNLTINPAGDQDNPDVVTGLDSISDCLVVVYGFDNATKTWAWHNPSWPPEANTLTTLYMGSGYWINVSEGCDFLTYGANTYELYEDWNLVGWLGYQEHVGDNPDVATGLDTIGDWLVVVYGFDNATKTWTWYNPSWPPGANTLDTLYMGSGYWINVSEVSDLIYEANTYELDEGWNLIGWCGATAGQDNSVSQFIEASQGGTITLQNSRGDEMTLDIPPDALPNSTTMTLTALDAPPVNPISSNIFPGVVIQPQGLMLLEPAELKVSFATAIPNPELSLLFYLKQSDFVLPLGNQTVTSTESQGDIYHFSTYSGGQPSESEAIVQGGKAGDSSPSDPYGWQDTYDAVQALLKWAEMLDQMGNEGEAQEMRDKAEQVAGQDAASFLDQPIPSDPCGDYLHTLLKFEQLAIMLGLQDIEQQLHERGTQILDQCTNRFELEVDYHQLVDWSESHWHFQDQLAYSGRVPFWVPMYDVQEFGPIEGEGTLTIAGNGLDDMEDEYCVWTTSGTVDLTASGEMRLNELLELEIVITLDGTASMSQTFTCCWDGGECETWTQGNAVPVTFGPYTLPVEDGYTIEESITATTLPPGLPPYVSVQGTLSLTLHILHLPT